MDIFTSINSPYYYELSSENIARLVYNRDKIETIEYDNDLQRYICNIADTLYNLGDYPEIIEKLHPKYKYLYKFICEVEPNYFNSILKTIKKYKTTIN